MRYKKSNEGSEFQNNQSIFNHRNNKVEFIHRGSQFPGVVVDRNTADLCVSVIPNKEWSLVVSSKIPKGSFGLWFADKVRL